jgi:hypothetical protein
VTTVTPLPAPAASLTLPVANRMAERHPGLDRRNVSVPASVARPRLLTQGHAGANPGSALACPIPRPRDLPALPPRITAGTRSRKTLPAEPVTAIAMALTGLATAATRPTRPSKR